MTSYGLWMRVASVFLSGTIIEYMLSKFNSQKQ